MCPASCHKLHIFNFFRTILCQVTKLTTYIPIGVLKKYCIFLKLLKIQDGCTGLWLAETFSTSPELHVKLPELILKKCCYFSERSDLSHCLPDLWLADYFFFSFFPKKYIYNVYEVTWFVRNVPLGFLRKCLYSGEIQFPAPWNLIELDIFTSFPEKLYSNFAGMFL